MKKLVVAMLVAVGGQTAMADGFVCETQDGALRVKAFNHVTPEKGTRTPAMLVLSDTRVAAGRKTIAKFDADQTLGGSSTRYVANVDLRFSNSNRAGEYLLGTRLGEIDEIIVKVDFSYAEPVVAGEEVDGEIVALMRDGDVIRAPLSCVRYLKN